MEAQFSFRRASGDQDKSSFVPKLTKTTHVAVTSNRPSSPRHFFAKIYGNLDNEAKSGPSYASGPDAPQADSVVISRSYQLSIPDIPMPFPRHLSGSFEGPRRFAPATATSTRPAMAERVAAAGRAVSAGRNRGATLPTPRHERPIAPKPHPVMFHHVPGMVTFPFMPNFFASANQSPPPALPPPPPLTPMPRSLHDHQNLLRPLMPQEGRMPAAFSAFLARRRRKEGRPRRQRTTFSTDQTLRLEIEYHRMEYISRTRRFEMAESLALTETQIKIWFQNRRAKDKRIEKAHIDIQCRSLALVRDLVNFSPSFPSPVPVPVAGPGPGQPIQCYCAMCYGSEGGPGQLSPAASALLQHCTNGGREGYPSYRMIATSNEDMLATEEDIPTQP